MTHNVTAQYRDYLLQTTGRTHELATYDVDTTEFFIIMEGADVWANWPESVGSGALANETTVVYGGNCACKITTGAAAATYLYQTFTVTAGAEYTLRFWTQGDGTNAGNYYLWDVSNWAAITAVISTGVTAAEYTFVEKDFTAPAGCTSARIYLRCAASSGGICYFDSCEVFDITAGTGTNLLTNGGFETSGARILMETGDKILYEEQVADAATYVLNAQYRDYLLTAEQVDRE